MAPLTPGFDRLGTAERVEYFLTLALAGASAILLIAPTAFHRVLFRLGDKEYLVTTANRLTIAGLATVALSMVGAFVFVADILFGVWGAVLTGTAAAAGCLVLWAVIPLARRRQLEL